MKSSVEARGVSGLGRWGRLGARRGRAALLGLGGLLLSGAVQAQETERVPGSNGDGMDTHLFRPAVDSKGFFYVNGTDILGANDVSFGLVLDWGHRLMRTRVDDEAIDPDTGELTLIGYTVDNVEVPRSFAIDPTGTWLYVGNQAGDSIVQFEINQETGELTPTGHMVETIAPVALVFNMP